MYTVMFVWYSGLKDWFGRVGHVIRMPINKKGDPTAMQIKERILGVIEEEKKNLTSLRRQRSQEKERGSFDPGSLYDPSSEIEYLARLIGMLEWILEEEDA